VRDKVAAAATYSGFGVNAVDAKGRLAIPADLRAVIETKAAGRVMMLAPHHRQSSCLIGYDRPRLDRISARLEAKYGTDDSEEREDETRRLIGLAQPIPFDDSGRLIFGPEWRELAGIDRFVVFIGMGDYFEIWDPETYKREKGDPMVVRFIDRALAGRA
jgi:MraZ protein